MPADTMSDYIEGLQDSFKYIQVITDLHNVASR